MCWRQVSVIRIVVSNGNHKAVSNLANGGHDIAHESQLLHAFWSPMVVNCSVTLIIHFGGERYSHLSPAEYLTV